MHTGKIMFEFEEGSPLPRRGFTSVEAPAFLNCEFPHIPHWICWYPHWPDSVALRKIQSKNFAASGTVGEWSWKQISTSYPVPHYWHGDESMRAEGDRWVGVIEVRGPDVEPFLLCSFLDSMGIVGRMYFASTQDISLLRRFGDAVQHHFYPEGRDAITIEIDGGEPIALKSADNERIFLPAELQRDIEQQVYSFFENKAIFTRLRVRHRRGFLFVGPPGTGKTLMLRHLIRQCHQRYKPSFSMLTIRRRTDVDDVAQLFARAVNRAPAIVILEDMDSLTTQSMITRSALLSQLDGVGSKDGLLIIGTTNNAAEIDPALVHRPSRFDRVWHFPLPNYTLRLEYLASTFENLSCKSLDWLAERTEGWSFAYLNELRTTAAILGIDELQTTAAGLGVSPQTIDITEVVVMDAYALLAAQFTSGRKNHQVEPQRSSVGFYGR